jgi:hypothetical protein
MPQTRIPEPNEECRRRDSNPRHADYDPVLGPVWGGVQEGDFALELRLRGFLPDAPVSDGVAPVTTPVSTRPAGYSPHDV